jgi:hypothetical protein
MFEPLPFSLLIGGGFHTQQVGSHRLLLARFTVGNQLLDPPLGAFLFAATPSAPFALHAAVLAIAAVLVARLRLNPTTTETEASAISVSDEILEGLRWLGGNRGLRR